jgi:hypothetical protein
MPGSKEIDPRRVLDNDDFNADWPKRTYDLGFTTLRELADFLGFHPASKDFKAWLKNANKLAWVDDAPPEIRIAIRSMKE